MAETRSKAEEHLDRADRMLAEARGKSEPDADSEWDIDTARHEIEELKAAVAKQPSSPEIHVHVDSKPDSDPPASTGFALSWKRGLRMPSGKLPPWAVVVIALGVAVIAAVAWVVVKTH